MAKVRDRLTVSAKNIADLAAWYRQVPDAWKGIDPRVIETALRLARGNAHRITTDDKRTLVIHNWPVW